MPRDVPVSESDDAAFLRDMLDACERIARFVHGKSIDTYRSDEMLRSAVERQIEIVGEAANRVSKELQTAHAENAWRPIIAQRHILAHEYGEIEHDLIWRVATVHVPVLQRQLLAILPAGQ